MFAPWWRRAPKRGLPTRKSESLSPAVERLEDRTVPSSSIPLNPSAWTFMGPAPVQTSGNNPWSGRVTGLAADPRPAFANTYYAATASGGVWKTTDAGVNWAPLTDTQATLFVGALALAPSNPAVIYAGTGEANLGPSKLALTRDNIYYGQGVLKSSDGGANWTLLPGPSNAFFRRTFSRIVVDAADANTVYAAVGNEATNGLSGNTGVWKSTDGGTTWLNTTDPAKPGGGTGITGSTTTAFSDLIPDPTNPLILYAAVGEPGGSTVNGIFKTVDGGLNWNKLGNAPDGAADPRVGRITLAIARTDPTRLYAAVMESGASGFVIGRLREMVTSTTSGGGWALLPGTPNYVGDFGDYNTALAVDPSNPLLVYASGQTQVIRSANGGNTWTDISTGVDGRAPHADHHALVFDQTGRLLDGNDGGVWRLDNATLANLRWGDLNATLGTIQFTGVALHPNSFDIAFGGSQDNGTERFDDSRSWNLRQGGDGGFVRVEPGSAGPTVYHTFFYPQPPSSAAGFLERSDNGGASWASKTSGINTLGDTANFYPPYVLDPSLTTRLVLGTNHVYETVNRGDSWGLIGGPGSVGWSGSANVDAVAVTPGNVNVVYAAAGGQVFVTTNRGLSWTATFPTGFFSPALKYHDLLVDPQDATGMTAYAVAANFNDVTLGGHVWRTVNGGASWAPIGPIAAGFPDLPSWSLALDPNGAGSADDVLYVGTDAGVYTSTNLGASWTPLATGLPNVQVNDLDLVTTGQHILGAGTNGRGLWEIFNKTTDLNWAGGSSVPSTSSTDTDTTFTLTYTYNVAAGAVPDDFTVAFFASKTGVFGSADPTDNLFLGSEVVTAPADKTPGLHTRTSPPLRVGRPGTYTLISLLDPYDNLTETSEANNVLSDSAIAVALGALGKGDGLLAAYYPNTAYSGPAVTRTDATVNFDWSTGQAAPYPGFGKNNFGVRWSGQVQAQFSETYTFYTTSDDGVRLFVDGKRLINNFTAHPATENSGTIALVAGRKYDIWLDYFEGTGGATAKLSWSSPSTPKQVVPQDALFSTRSSVPFTTVADYNGDGVPDLWVFLLSGTASGNVEVRVLDGAANFTNTLLSTPIALGPTDLNTFAFEVGDFNHDGRPDIWAIKKTSTGSNSTEVHILSGAANFQTFLVHTATVLAETDATWAFQVVDYNRDGTLDVVGFKKSGTGSNRTEIHVLDGATGFQSFLTHLATGLGETGAEAYLRLGDFNNDGVRDLYYVKKFGTGSGLTEVHILSGASSFQTFLLHIATPLGPSGSSADFGLADFDRNGVLDVYFVPRFNTGSDRIEVHPLSGSTNYTTFLTHLATVHPSSGPFGQGPLGARPLAALVRGSRGGSGDLLRALLGDRKRQP